MTERQRASLNAHRATTFVAAAAVPAGVAFSTSAARLIYYLRYLFTARASPLRPVGGMLPARWIILRSRRNASFRAAWDTTYSISANLRTWCRKRLLHPPSSASPRFGLKHYHYPTTLHLVLPAHDRHNTTLSCALQHRAGCY